MESFQCSLQRILSLGTSTSNLVEFIAVESTKSPVTERDGKPILIQVSGSQIQVFFLLRKERHAEGSDLMHWLHTEGWPRLHQGEDFEDCCLYGLFVLDLSWVGPGCRNRKKTEVTGRQILTIEIKILWQRYKIGVGCIQR